MLAARAALGAGIAYCFTEHVADVTLCEGPSMMPTIRQYGEIVLVDKRSAKRSEGGVPMVGEERAEAARQRQRDHARREVERMAKEKKEPKKRVRPERFGWKAGDIVIIRGPDEDVEPKKEK